MSQKSNLFYMISADSLLCLDRDRLLMDTASSSSDLMSKTAVTKTAVTAPKLWLE